MPNRPVTDRLEASTPGFGDARFLDEVARYDESAEVVRLGGPRHRAVARVLGVGPSLIVVPGVASTYRGYGPMLNRLAGRFRTVVFDYPGDDPHDGARLTSIGHDDLVDDLLDLRRALGLGPTFLFGISFGSTITLRALARAPEHFPRAAIQGGFAHRGLTRAEALGLRLGRLIPGEARRLPFQGMALRAKNRRHFPVPIADRWPYYVEQNGLTPIAALAHRLDLLARLDLRPSLPEIATPTLLIQGSDDPIVGRPMFEALRHGLPNATAVLWEGVGHQPHFTHFEALADAVGDFFLANGPE